MPVSAQRPEDLPPCEGKRTPPSNDERPGHLSTASGRNRQGRMWAADLLPSSLRGSSSCATFVLPLGGYGSFLACRSFPEHEEQLPAQPSLH